MGVDVTSNYPEAVNQLEKVGYVRSLSAEKVLALAPTLVLGFSEGLKPEVQQQFKSAGLQTGIFTQEYSIAGTEKLILEMAWQFHKQQEADSLIERLHHDLAKVETLPVSPRVLFIYARGAGAMMVAGNHTAPKKMIELAGGQNAISGFDDFKPLTPEALVNANPDIILLFDSGLQSLGGVKGLLSLPGVLQTRAGKNRHIIEMDGQLLAGFGPRVGEAPAILNQQFKHLMAAQ